MVSTATLLDLVLQLVDLDVERHDLPAGRNVAADQGVDGIDDLPLRQAAHLGDQPSELLQIDVEGLGGVF